MRIASLLVHVAVISALVGTSVHRAIAQNPKTTCAAVASLPAWDLDCANPCSEGECHKDTDESGSWTYTSCECDEGGASACCNLLVGLGPGGAFSVDAIGSCSELLGCGVGGTCALDLSGSQYTAECPEDE